MKTKLVLLIMAMLISSTLFTACNQKEVNEETKNESMQVEQDRQDNSTTSSCVEKKQIKNSLEKDLNIEISVSEDDLQKYKSKIISYVHAGDKKALREEATLIKTKYKDDQQMRDIYALLYYRSILEGNLGSEEYPLSEEGIEVNIFLEKESIQDQPITEALIDIGIVTSASEEDLQKVRDEVVRLIRGKAETEEEFFEYQDELMKKTLSMNPVNASAYLQVNKVAKEEAFHGSKTYPHPEGH